MSVLNSRAVVCCQMNESALVEFQRTASIDLMCEPEPSRCGKPGAWRNRSTRCEHGFEHGDPRVVCPVHSPKESKLRASKCCSIGPKRQPRHTLRAMLLTVLRDHGPQSLLDLSTLANATYGRVKPAIREMRRAGFVADFGKIRITESGLVKLDAMFSELRAREERYRAGVVVA